MELKFLIIGIIIIIIFSLVFYYFQSIPSNESQHEIIQISSKNSLFTIHAPSTEETIMISQFIDDIDVIGMEFELKPELSDVYLELGFLNKTANIAVIYPTFTESAYSKNGFYDYFNEKCNESCLTVSIQDDFKSEYTSSRNAYKVFQLLGYDILTDIDVDRNPKILKKYDKVILLHNEYVTKSMFNAITSHSKVIYLYPNALYAEIQVDYNLQTISLIRGHNYPEQKIINGFDWEFENTPMEYDKECNDWKFYEIDNGHMLNCYPEMIIFKDQKLLEIIKTK